MLVTLTGAFRNAGDYLIGHRARALLREYVDGDILNLNRLALTEENYADFNKSRAVILCGGPAYQPQIYPKIYPIDLDRIETKVVPMGLGWKGNLAQKPADFKFPEPAEQFIRRIHENIKLSSVRDDITLSIIKGMGIDNVSMTGCPAWYDLDFIDQDYHFDANPKRIVFSLPAKPQPDTFGIIDFIAKQFPKAEKILALHHGWRPSKSAKGNEMRNWHLKVAARGALRGWATVSIADGLDKMLELYGSTDLHIGYRVHAHLFSLSHRIPSILIAEDSRGVGQVESMGGHALLAGAGAQSVNDAILRHLDTKGAEIEASVAKIKATFPTMVEFLKTL